MMKTLFASITLLIFSIANSSADTFGTEENQFEIEFVTISSETNPIGDYGIVTNDYRMGIYEITNNQWNKFVNSYGAVTGTPTNAYDQSPHNTGANVPVSATSWYEVAQFVNWLNTSTHHQAAYKFIGTPGTSDYTFSVWDVTDTGYDASNPYRNSNATYFLPTEDEWFKAAYWNGTSVQTFATKPGDTLYQGNGANGGWNYLVNPYLPLRPFWGVGSGSQELNGTYDMMGNAAEWTESPYSIGNYSSGADRAIRGGGIDSFSDTLSSSSRHYCIDGPRGEWDALGFRIASIPEPATLALLGLGGLALLRKRR